jgi:hypothetical protein
MHGGQEGFLMSEQSCANPIDAGPLADYWLALLSPEEEELVETHLLGCDACGDRLREIIAIADVIRRMAREGTLRVIVSESFLNHATREGLRIRQYALPAGGSVNCTVTSEDDLAIARLAADLSTVQRVDLCFSDPRGTVRLFDIPVNSKSGEVIFNESIGQLRTAPAHVGVIQLIAVDERGDHLLGEYTFNHSPSDR